MEQRVDLKEKALHICIGDIEFERIFPMKLGIPCMPHKRARKSILGPLFWIIDTLMSSTVEEPGLVIAGRAFGDVVTLGWPQRTCSNGREAGTEGTPLIQINWLISIRASAGRPNIRWYRAPIRLERLEERSIALTLDLHMRLHSGWRWVIRLRDLLVGPFNLMVLLFEKLEWFDIKLGLVPYENHLEFVHVHSHFLSNVLPSKLEEQAVRSIAAEVLATETIFSDW